MGVSSVFLMWGDLLIDPFSEFFLHANMIDHIDMSYAHCIRENERKSSFKPHGVSEGKK